MSKVKGRTRWLLDYWCVSVVISINNCLDAVSGRWSGESVSIAVSYKKITGRDYDSGFGRSDNSWTLWCPSDASSCSGYCLMHDNIRTNVSGPLCPRVVVYQDHKAGSLSFYSVSGTMSLLHRVQTTFTQPLFPGFCFGFVGDTAELCKL